MRRIDWLMLAAGLSVAMIWTLISSKNGFKGNNAMIVARSVSVTSTIDGQIDNTPPEVGAQVNVNELLVSIHNSRIDRSRLAEFESNIDYLKREIENVESQQSNLTEMLKQYQEKAAAHSAWMLNDISLQNIEKAKQLEVAEKTEKLKVDKVQRAAELYRLQHASSVVVETAQIEADIAKSELDLTRAGLKRTELLHKSVKNNGMFFENGDASYWDKMIDELSLRYVDNSIRLQTLSAELTRAQSLAAVEKARIGSTIEEKHHAPFTGLVNASYVANGTRVTIGTSLLQVLDCSNPIVIVPIPEHRISEFSVGMKVTIYPVDTDFELPGTIDYISSGPLIGHDQTLLVQEDLTLSGVHAVVGFTEQQSYHDPARTCESAHKAVVVIHTASPYNTVSNWITGLWKNLNGVRALFKQIYV